MTLHNKIKKVLKFIVHKSSLKLNPGGVESELGKTKQLKNIKYR